MRRNGRNSCACFWSKTVLLAIAASAAGTVGCSGRGADSSVEAPKLSLNVNPQTPNFAVYAQNSASLRDRVGITGGDVGVRLAGTGPFVGGAYELVLTSDSHVDPARNVIANRVQLSNRAHVGDIQVSQLVNQNGSFVHQYPFPANMPALPPTAPVTPGTAALTVNTAATLVASPGSYGAVSVGDRGILRLKGGVYQLASLSLTNDARLEALAPVQVRVAGRFSALDRVTIVAAAGVTLAAGDLRIEVSGKNGNSGALTDSPKAAAFGNDGKVSAVILAPNGTLVTGQRTIAVGAYVGRDVYVDMDSTITYQSGVGPSGCLQSCDDSNPCTVDTCSVGVCVHTSSPAGTSCSDGNACNGAEKCDGAARCQAGTPVVCAALDQCHAVGICDVATGACSNPAKPNGTVCDDGNACTKTDVCAAGVCGGTAYTCNDGLACTADSCNGDGTCTFAVTAGNCLINGTCYASATTNPANQCEQCTPATSKTAWTPKSSETACDDGNACTKDDACDGASVCSGTAYTCSDGLDCTADACNGDGTCAFAVIPGNCVIDGACYAAGATNTGNQCQTCAPSVSATSWSSKSTGTVCNDGNACTSNDICTASVCAGTAYSCDDGLGCTADSCNGDGTCKHIIAAGSCVIDGTCYTSGASNPADSCQICDVAKATGWSNQADGTTCNDSSACTGTDAGSDSSDGGDAGGDAGGTCPSHTCIAGACKGVCAPGKLRCDGQTAQTCDATGNWKDDKTCVNQACVEGACQGVCTPGTLQCNGQTTQTCDATGAWQDGAACANQACVAGTCQGVCAPGSQQCNGQTTQSCDTTGNWQDGATCLNQACVTGVCQGVCAPGAVQCNGQTPQTCTVAGNWQNGATCVNQTCVAGACQGLCAPGDQQCVGQAPQTCDPTGNWQTGPDCQDQACVGGACLGACTPGTKQCSGYTPQTCDATGTWQNGQDCYPTQTCGGGGVPGECSPACTNLCLREVRCSDPNVTTTISGKVYAPNGTDPLMNAVVYVPNATVQPFPAGVTCDACGPAVTGEPLVLATTGADGSFSIKNAPTGANVPVVIQIGRWRRQIVVANVTACQNNALTASQTRLPAKQTEGDMPLIAMVTGWADVMECVLRKIGIADSEFTNPTGTGRVRLYKGDVPSGAGAVINSSTPFESSLWGSQAAINAYDAVFFGCEASAATRTAAAKQTLVNFANAGGRVYLSHYGYMWLDDYAPFSTTATWAPLGAQPLPDPEVGHINMTFPKGLAMAQWLQSIGATTTLGQMQLNSLRHDFTAVSSSSQLWMSINPTNISGSVPMHYTFDTPVGAPAATQCGRVAYSDFHVEYDTVTGVTFPAECVPGAMTPQEKMLEFMLFDLTSCLAN